MEPLSTLSAISPILLKAAESIKARIDGANKLASDDAQYYGAWIQVASEAIKGLQDEYIDILREAAHCRLNKPKEKKHLLIRIGNYIHGEVLRPLLKGAIKHLDVGEEALQQHAKGLFLWGTVKKKRATALTKYKQLLRELTGHLGSLGDYTGPSAVALEDLKKVQTLLYSGPPGAVVDLVDDLLMNLNKAEFMKITGECALVIETLRIAFR